MKVRTRKIPNMDIFHAVFPIKKTVVVFTVIERILITNNNNNDNSNNNNSNENFIQIMGVLVSKVFENNGICILMYKHINGQTINCF